MLQRTSYAALVEVSTVCYHEAMQVRWLTTPQVQTWLKFRAVTELLPGVLDGQLRRDSGLSLMEYQVLAMLSEAPDRQLRMTALARRSNASLTRLSHVATRLEARGYILRCPCAEDGRATVASLTDVGWQALVAAAPGHVHQVRDSVVDVLTPEQLDQLDAIATALLGRLDPEGKLTAVSEPAGAR